MNKKAKTSTCGKTDKEALKNKEELQEEVNSTENAATDAETSEKCSKESKEDNFQETIEKLQAVIEDKEDKYLRLSAEFDNYRKRTRKEKTELILNGGEKTISSILPVIDDFERALDSMKSAENVEAVKEGVDLIYDKLMKTLEKNGVKIIETKEIPLDTDYHEAIAVIPAPAEELKGKILDCVQTGYLLNEKVIRHAKVVVGE